jgi:hypothetical protein
MTHATWYDGCPPGWIPGQAVLAGVQGTPNRKTTTLSRARSGGTPQVHDMVDTTTFTAEVQGPPSILLSCRVMLITENLGVCRIRSRIRDSEVTCPIRRSVI